MKAFLASVILFSLLMACIILNVEFIHRSTDALALLAEQIENPLLRECGLSDLERRWQHDRPWISLTVGFRELDHFEEIIAQLRWAYDSENESEFLRYRALLLDAVEELRRTERFSIENLL